MHKIIKATEGTIRHISPNKFANNLITKEISPNLSLATIEAQDYYEQETTLCNRIYYVLQGALTIIADGETNELREGDVCFIGEDTTYDMSGTFKAVVVNQPAFGSR